MASTMTEISSQDLISMRNNPIRDIRLGNLQFLQSVGGTEPFGCVRNVVNVSLKDENYKVAFKPYNFEI